MKNELTDEIIACLREHASFKCIEGNEKRMVLAASDLLEAKDAEIAALHQKAQENELMAECTVMLRDDLIEAGIVDKTVPPMMLTEAILKYARALRQDAKRYRWLSLQDLTYLSLGYIVDREHDGEYCVDLLDDTFYGETLGAAIDKAMTQAVQP